MGQISRVLNVTGTGRVSKRLMEMGVLPGVEVRVVKTGPFDDPMEIRLLGYNLAIRRNEAASIEISAEARTE